LTVVNEIAKMYIGEKEMIMTKGGGNQTLGDFVKSRRQTLGMSYSVAGDRSDLHPSYWNKLERGFYQKPDPRLLRNIADALQVPVEDLYALAGYEVPKQLPSLRPYLRAKYNLPSTAIAELERYFELLRNYYGIPKDQPVFPPKPSNKAPIPPAPWGDGPAPWGRSEVPS
jgi:transcriptional regulator with XRE-family HTH domain